MGVSTPEIFRPSSPSCAFAAVPPLIRRTKNPRADLLYFGLSDLSYFRSQSNLTAPVVNENIRFFSTGVALSNIHNLPHCNPPSTDFFQNLPLSFSQPGPSRMAKNRPQTLYESRKGASVFLIFFQRASTAGCVRAERRFPARFVPPPELYSSAFQGRAPGRQGRAPPTPPGRSGWTLPRGPDAGRS